MATALSPIKKTDKIIVSETQIHCDGSVMVGAGHPGVYLNLGDKKEIDCPYCGAVYKKSL